MRWEGQYLQTQNTHITFLSGIAAVQVIFWAMREFIQLQTQKTNKRANSNFLWPIKCTLFTWRIRTDKIFSLVCATLSLASTANNEFLFMKTHRVLNRLNKCANVHYCKDQVFLWFTINSQWKLKKFTTVFLSYLLRKTSNEKTRY